MPRSSTRIRLIAALLFAAGCHLAPGVSARGQTPPSTEMPNDAMAQLVQRLTELQRDLDPADEASLFAFDGPTDTAREWLDRLTPLAAELQQASSMLEARQFDRAQGYRLLLPHLSGLRSASRAVAYLASDAMRRGDAAAMLGLLRAQRDLTMHSASDGLTISSLVAMAQAGLARESFESAIDRGLLDRETAAEALEISRALGDGSRYGLAEAMRSESEGFGIELARLSDASDDAREGLIVELTGEKPQPGVDLTSDDAITRARADAADYFRTAEAAMANPDRAAGHEALVALDAWVQDEERSPLLRLFAPALTRVQERLAEHEQAFATINGRLAAIADGSRAPADFANAAPHYLAAAQLMSALDEESQQTIEAVRLAGDEMPLEDRMRARRMCDALRERVIDRLLAAAACGRCEFAADEGPTLLAQGVIGANGAARLLLIEPLVPGERRDAHTRVDAVVATLAMSRHYASAGGFGRALVAQEVARDARRELEALTSRELLDADGRARIAAALARFEAGDPFGFRAAADFDRSRLASRNGRFEARAIAGLSPNVLAFLVAITTPSHDAAASERCDCPHDGPLVSIRGRFDAVALADARSQRGTLLERRSGAGALDGLRVTVPVDIEARTAEADAEFARLRELSAAK